MFITTFAQNYSQNAGNAISKTQKFLESRGGNCMHPDPQKNARLQAKINFPISGKHGFFLLLANTLSYKSQDEQS
jgi:hypothetical protein